jgi:Domain of unknown function (DUF4815)
MSLNFNVDPYYDDFDQTKNYHRILFKPGAAVQARELTQAQTILQDQVTKFADNIFKQNSPVTGGQVTTNLNCHYVKLQSTFNNVAIDLSKWYNATTNQGLLVQNVDGSVVARVIQTVAATGTGGAGDPPALILSYKTGSHFQDNDVIYDLNSNMAIQAVAQNSTGLSSVASIAQGVFYILGNFVQIQPQTVVVDKFNNTPSRRIGLTINETIHDFIDDASLLDPALGASNYQAPGADRYFIGLTLDSRPIQFGDDQNFVELVRMDNGAVQKLVDGSVYNVIDDYFAKRDFETNGDYVVNDFKLTPKTNVDSTKYTMSVGKGLAYVHGYRIENTVPVDLVSDRARTTASQNNNPVFVDYGSYFYVDSVRGANSGIFDVTTSQTIDLHCVPYANVDTTNTATYSATVVGSGYIRGLVYDHDTSDSDANTYVYKAYVHGISNKTPTANATGGSTNTITLPATFSKSNSAYIGVNISITTGPSAGDFRTITSYNGVTRVATVNQNWTSTPTSASVFSLNYDTKDTTALVSVDANLNIVGKATIDPEGKINGATVLENANAPELLFKLGSPYVATLTGTAYTTQQVFRNISFTSTGSGISTQLNYEGATVGILRHFGTPSSTLSTDLVKQNYTVIVTNKGSNTLINNGDIVEWTTAGKTVALDSDASIATFTATSGTGLLPFTADIIAKVYVENADNTGFIQKYKNLITANTQVVVTNGTLVNLFSYVDDSINSSGQVYIQNGGLVTSGQKQSLYLSDVKNIVKIIDTGASGTLPTVAMLSNPAYDITSNYLFDNGQRDDIYDHASITLRTGAPQPKGNILVLVNYYQHSGGDGYFSINSYLTSSKPETYTGIPVYKSKNGTAYSLRDAIDFRPARKNAQVLFDYRYSTTSSSNYGVILPTDLTLFTSNYSYYLARKDKLILSKDKTFQIIEGAPSLTPLAPAEPDGSLVIANLSHDPYTGFLPTESVAGTLSNLSIEKVQHKRYTMQDIAGLETRINQIEYYTSLSLLEQKASALQISDAFGLNRFKNGILVDDFSSFSTADTLNSDFAASINRRDHALCPAQNVQNFPFKSLALNNSLNNLANTVNLGYGVGTDGYVNYFSLPYTTANVASQKFASRTVNVNPFSFTTNEGIVALSPNVDNWVDTNYAPSLLITDPNLQVFQSTSNINLLSAGDWKTIPGTTSSSTVSVVNHGNPNVNSPYGSQVGYTQSTSIAQLTQTSIYGAYSSIGNTYSLNNGYITDISILPYVRAQQIVVRAKGMLFNTVVNSYFDNTNVDAYTHKANIIELTGVSGSFKEDDVIGYMSGTVFTPTARVLGVYVKSSGVRLYVAADSYSTTYTGTGTIVNGNFDANGVYVNSTASGTLSSTSHNGARLAFANTTTSIQLSSLASATDSYYNGNTIYINAGTGVGQSATITAYNGTTKVATLGTAVSAAASDVYSIGTLKTDETGSFYGVFNLPAATFHTGQRVFKLDNSYGNPGAETTFSQGTFYSEGLQTTQQGIDFGASPAGAKNTFASTATKTNVSINYSPYDPVAQTFMVSKDNYPNGLFLKSISVFFASKPLTDSSPVRLSIVGTLNGYPTGDTLDHSLVVLPPDKVKVSSAPQYLDSAAATTFEFNAPIYIQPDVLYAFMLKSNSNEYVMWSASSGDIALSSSTKNLPTDPTPSTITKIGSAPYVGSLFLSQNAQTWTTDQNQSLMFVIDRCVFNTAAAPTITYSVPQKLPQRTLFNQSLNYYLDANNVSATADSISNSDILVDAFNITTTDFVPTTTGVSYSYNATLVGGASSGLTNINPGKFGTPTQNDIYLNDGKGERVLVANSDTSLELNATLTSNDNAVSPIISDAGLSAYTIKWSINNLELSNSLITVANTGASYNAQTTTVTVSAPTGINGTQAFAAANVANGAIQSVYITYPGSGYTTTPTLTINDGSGAGAVAFIAGETSKHGGNALARYVTKKVVLDQGFDSGDLNVYLSAYRPVNTDINVYYKVLNRNDTQAFEDGSWQLMTKVNSSGSKYSSNRGDIIEYSFAPGTTGTDQGYVSYTSTNGQTYTTFSQFAIKIVMSTSDHTYVPVISDIRAIALPPNVNTTF